MEKRSEIFVIESENSNILKQNIDNELNTTDINELFNGSSKFENSILFFENSLNLGMDVIEKIILFNPSLILIVFYKDSVENMDLNRYFKAGVADSTLVDDNEYIKQLLNRYNYGGDESNIVFYNNMVNKFAEIGIISNSLKMAEIFSVIEKVGRSNSSVLITGESGTGKELIAKSIHYFSNRKNGNFVGINTGAIPENLLEDELFGHVKGAFTSALKDRKGKFEFADKGTIFLDEISNMPQSLQVKLLRVLQEREFVRVGDNSSIKIDVRVIAATNKDLSDMVKEGSFREDLYYRLNVIPISIPPLRERKSDIPLLANYFIKKYCSLNGFKQKTIAMSAVRILKEFSWPGNIRHLENTIERMVVLNPDTPILSPKDIPEEIINDNANLYDNKNEINNISLIPEDGIALNDILKGIERKYIMQSLEKTAGNKQKAAKLLNIKRTTLIEKLKKMKIN